MPPPIFGIMGSTNDIDDAIVPMLAETRMVVENEPVVAQLVRSVTLGKGDGESWREPYMNTTMEAQSLTYGVDMQNPQKWSDTMLTVTPAEVGIQVILIDKLLRIVRDDLMAMAGQLMGRALVRRLDTDGIAMFAGFSAQVGGAGVGLTQPYLAAGEAQITGATQPYKGPIYGVFHQHQFHPLMKNLAPTGTYPIPSGLSQEIIENGFVMKTIGGVNLFRDNNITKDANSDATGALFARDALILVKVGMPGIERERDASLRGWELNQIWEYGYGEREDSWGVRMFFDAVTPTG